MHLRQPLVARQAPIPREAPAQAALPRMARNQAAKARRNDQDLQEDGAALVVQRTVEQLQDRHEGGRRRDFGEVAHDAEEHGDGEEPGGHEADGYGAHDGDRDHAFGLVHFLGHVGCAVETGEGPVGVDEADDEGNAALAPARVVDKGREDEFGMLVRGRGCGDGDQDDDEGEEGCVERECGYFGESLAVAVEEEAEKIRKLVSNEDVPGFNRAGDC